MRIIRHLILPLLLLQPVVVHANWPHRITGESNTWIGMVSPVIYDLNDDGSKELVLTTQGNPHGYLSALYILNAAGNEISQVDADYYFDPRTFPSLADVDNDGGTELVLECGELLIYDAQGALERTFPTEFMMSDNLFAATVLADINNDGIIEVIYGGWYLDGSRLVVLDNNGNNAPGFPIMLEPQGNSEVNTPAVGDLDGDGNWEIVTISHPNAAPPDTTNIRAFDTDGAQLWSQRVSAISRCDPVIGDVNADGANEVVFSSEAGIYILDASGNFLLKMPLGQSMEHSNIALANLDGDGDLEIVFGYGLGLYAIHHDGSTRFLFQSDWDVLNPPIIGDLDSDGVPDILLNSDNEIYALNDDGTVLSGFPKSMWPIAYSSPSIDDLDADGLVDVVSSSNWIEPTIAVGIVYDWELGASYDTSSMPWQMYQHDPQHTGYYGNRPPADVSDGPHGVAAAARLTAVPNPSTGHVRLTYRLPSAAAVTVEVFNAAGSLVRRLENGPRPAGEHVVQWDGRDDRGEDLASGVYLARVSTAEGIRTGRMVIAR